MKTVISFWRCLNWVIGLETVGFLPIVGYCCLAKDGDTPARYALLGVGILLMGVGVLIWYLTPAIIAHSRRNRNAVAITVVNVFLGWSLLGWVGALAWAYVE